MPYSKCPICGSLTHLNVADPATWYRERYPDLPFGSIVPGVCFYCFGDISIGSRVFIRSHFTRHPEWAPIGAVGIVTNTISSNDGMLFQLQLDDGRDDYFVRGEIRKPHDNE
jgi:hypothetical protein